MLFIINEICAFNPHVGSVELYGAEGEPLMLSNPAGMLLSYFIEHKGEVLSRDVLIEHVWVRRGYASSGSNLNNTVSQLRRLLASCNVVDVIVTIPKVGFSFSADIAIIEPESSVDNTQHADNIVINEVESDNVGDVTQSIEIRSHFIENTEADIDTGSEIVNPKSPYKKMAVLCIIFSFVLSIFAVVYLFPHSYSDDIPLYNVTSAESTVGQCVVYRSNDLKKEDANFLMTKYLSIINERCNVKGTLYFISRKGEGHSMDDFISICLLDSDYCYSISSVGWRYYAK
ncbi:winged helix-turn-helix domain-containing protein [Plesiomonas sp.]|uniref:winged helix-turn-helix domain-containing protein n=1 Tax=Plesiomonas sp. TaxID=2486279 RepID=UPI003F406F95